MLSPRVFTKCLHKMPGILFYLGDPEMLGELDKTLKDPRSSFTQWKGLEFTRIQKALEQELKKIGWL